MRLGSGTFQRRAQMADEASNGRRARGGSRARQEQAELEMLRKVRASLEGLRQLLHKVKEVCVEP